MAGASGRTAEDTGVGSAAATGAGRAAMGAQGGRGPLFVGWA
jgi:hypothetical protein